MSDGRTLESAPRSGLETGPRRWPSGAASGPAQPRIGRRGNREKELFALRAQHVKALFRTLETLAAGDQQGGRHDPHQRSRRSLNPKNLGGIEVPDGARLVLKFLERRLEVVVNPLVERRRPTGAGRRARHGVGHPVRPGRPAGADWYDLTLREDGGWLRKAADGEPPPPPFGERTCAA